MSDKIKKQLEDTEKTFTIRPYELQYLRSLDTIKRSVEYYISQAQTEYLKILSVGLGFSPEKDLEFHIDLNDNKGELKVKEIPGPAEDDALDKNKEV
jgi:hypothetical protein